MTRRSESPGISDEVFARRDKLQVFVSSKMRDGSLDGERFAAITAIEGTGFAEPWAWERKSVALSVSSETICIGHARTSDALVLILADDLTPITQREFDAAWHGGVPCFIFLKDSTTRSPIAQDFIKEERNYLVTKTFRTLDELKTQVTMSLLSQALLVYRQAIVDARKRRARARKS